VTATSVTTSQANLSWTASTDNVGVAGYRIYRDGVQVGNTPQTSYADTGLTASTTYSYAVSAYDGAGNESPGSASVSVATAAAPDSVAPSAPSGLSVTSTASTEVGLSWSPSTDDVAVAGYTVYRDGTQVGTTTATTFTDTGLTPATAYSYTVSALDGAGNTSAPSSAVNPTTTGLYVPPVFKQVAYATPQTDQSSVAVTYASPQAAGDTNIIAIGWSDTTSTITSVTDSTGNAYRVAVPAFSGNGHTQAIYYATNIAPAAAGANTVTVGFSAAAPSVDVRITEFAGLGPVDPLDQIGSASGTSSMASSPAVTTTAPNELIFGAGTTGGVFSGTTAGFDSRVITNPDGNIVFDRNVTAIGSYASSANQSGGWVMQVATFKAATQ
jgi:chitodextrinase